VEARELGENGRRRGQAGLKQAIGLAVGTLAVGAAAAMLVATHETPAVAAQANTVSPAEMPGDLFSPPPPAPQIVQYADPVAAPAPAAQAAPARRESESEGGDD